MNKSWEEICKDYLESVEVFVSKMESLYKYRMDNFPVTEDEKVKREKEEEFFREYRAHYFGGNKQTLLQWAEEEEETSGND